MKLEEWSEVDFSKGLAYRSVADGTLSGSAGSISRQGVFPGAKAYYAPGECAALLNMDVTPDGLMTRRAFTVVTPALTETPDYVCLLGLGLGRLWAVKNKSSGGGANQSLVSWNTSFLDDYSMGNYNVSTGPVLAASTEIAAAAPINTAGRVVSAFEYAGAVYFPRITTTTWIKYDGSVWTTFTGPNLNNSADSTLNNDPPGYGASTRYYCQSFVWKDRAWVVGHGISTIYFSKVGDPATWAAPDGGFFKVGVPSSAIIQKVIPTLDMLHIFTTEGYFVFRYNADPNKDGQLTLVNGSMAFEDACLDDNGNVFACSGSTVYAVGQGQLQPILEVPLPAKRFYMESIGDTLLFSKRFQYNLETKTLSEWKTKLPEAGDSPYVSDGYFMNRTRFKIESKSGGVCNVMTVENGYNSIYAGKLFLVLIHSDRAVSSYLDTLCAASYTPRTIRHRVVVDGTSMGLPSPMTFTKLRQATVEGEWSLASAQDPMYFGVTDNHRSDPTWTEANISLAGSPWKLRGIVKTFPTVVDNLASRIVRFGVNLRGRRPVFILDQNPYNTAIANTTTGVIGSGRAQDQRPVVINAVKVSKRVHANVVDSTEKTS